MVTRLVVSHRNHLHLADLFGQFSLIQIQAGDSQASGMADELKSGLWRILFRTQRNADGRG